MTPEQFKTTVVEPFYGRVKAYFHARLSNPADADDLTQTLFVSLWIYNIRIPAPPGTEPYVFVSARNLLYRHVRTRRSADSQGCDLDQLATLDPNPVEDSELLDLIEEMPPSLREVFLLRFVYGYSGAETARILGITENAVHIRARRGKIWLRKRLGLDGSGPADADTPADEHD